MGTCAQRDHYAAGSMTERARMTLVATPIGNLGDLSARAIEVLKGADVIACEDTRHSRKLLTHAGITGARLISVHEHNERDAAGGIVELLTRGLTVALVTDAGTPGISDPGAQVVAAVLAAGFEVDSVPGPVAAISALIISGLDTRRFAFEGFLPERGRDRRSAISTLANETRTIVLYEAPHRIVRLISELTEALGGTRRVSISRELTKIHETTWRGSLDDSAKAVESPRGEYVVVVEGAPVATTSEISASDLDALLLDALASGLRVKDAATLVGERHGVSKSEAYQRALALRRPVDPE